MANAPKDNPLSPTGPGALYYFPEIPCSAQKEHASKGTDGQFVGRSFDRNGESPDAFEDPRDSGQVRGLIEEAFNNGMDQGRAETITAQQKTVDQAAAALKAAADALISIRKRDVACMEAETVRLALAIAKKVIGHDCEHGQIITQVVKAAMKKVADPRQLTLKLNPKDVGAVEAIQQELLVADDVASLLHLEADETIQRGGCIIETQLGDVDARIDRQVKFIEELLVEQLPKLPVER